MHTKYRVLKGRTFLPDLLSIAGIDGVYPNPFGEGVDTVEIIHRRDPDQLPLVVKDQTIGNVILQRIIE